MFCKVILFFIFSSGFKYYNKISQLLELDKCKNEDPEKEDREIKRTSVSQIDEIYFSTCFFLVSRYPFLSFFRCPVLDEILLLLNPEKNRNLSYPIESVVSYLTTQVLLNRLYKIDSSSRIRSNCVLSYCSS